jgi:DNA-directed RNA polymerase subunit RPC12/RpoP
MAQVPDFTQKTKEILAKRAGQICSNPDCRKNTSGPHTEDDKAINLGEAAHIKAARKGQARYDPNMTDDERSDISNGIWLCKECARKIDLDETKYKVDLLYIWKKEHEDYISSGKPIEATREIEVSDGGIGSIIQNTSSGIGLDITHRGRGPAERITVKGEGVGEIVTNTGNGTGKRIIAIGGGPASESNVVVNKPVQMAVGMSATNVLTNCSKCGNNFTASKVIQGFAGDSEPKVKVNCPYCHTSIWI